MALKGAEKHRERLEWGTWYLQCALFALRCVALTGGTCSLEHPRDWGVDPFASVWVLDEVKAILAAEIGEDVEETVVEVVMR